MAYLLKFSFITLAVSLAVCVSANNTNQAVNNNIYPKFLTNQNAYSAQQQVHGGQIYNQYGHYPTQLPVSPVRYPAAYQKPFEYSAYTAYPVPIFGNQLGNIRKDTKTSFVAKSVFYSVLFSTLLNRVG